MTLAVASYAVLAVNVMIASPASLPTTQPQSRPAHAEIRAEVFPFPDRLGSVSGWTSIVATRGEQIVIGLCPNNAPAWLVQFDEASQKFVETIRADTVIHDKGKWKVAQGKIHSHLLELSDGWVYGGTHISEDGNPKDYPGGHWFRYDPRSHKMEDLGLGMAHEGLIAMQADEPRGCLYGITYPGAYLLRYDMVSRQTQVLGKTSQNGQVNRVFFVLGPGNVYTNEVYSPASQPGGIYVFDAETESGRVDTVPVRRKAGGGYTEPVEKDAASVYNYWLSGVADPTRGVGYTTGYYSGHFVSLHVGANQEVVVHDHGLTVPDGSGRSDSGAFSQAMYMVGDSVLFTVTLGPEKSDHVEVRLLQYDCRQDVLRELGVIRTTQGQPVTRCTAMTYSQTGYLYLLALVGRQESVSLLRIAPEDVGGAGKPAAASGK